MSINLQLSNSRVINRGREKHIPALLQAVKWLPCRLACFHRGKERGAVPRPSELAYKHTAALSAFMFIQLLASGTSQQNYSVCKFNLWAVTSNRRLFCRRDGGVCQSAGSYGLIGILSKHKGMMEELWCPCPFILSSSASLYIIVDL